MGLYMAVLLTQNNLNPKLSEALPCAVEYEFTATGYQQATEQD